MKTMSVCSKGKHKNATKFHSLHFSDDEIKTPTLKLEETNHLKASAKHWQKKTSAS
jgi:hypothetical protein